MRGDMKTAEGNGIQRKVLPSMLIAGVRMKAPYSECGKAFRKIGRALGRYTCGRPFLLHYQAGYSDIADYEACMPLRKECTAAGIDVRTLPGGPCLSFVHHGPYELLGQTYGQITEYIASRQVRACLPSREVYLKGPGIFLEGNPKRYVTEIQILIEENEPPT